MQQDTLYQPHCAERDINRTRTGIHYPYILSCLSYFLFNFHEFLGFEPTTLHIRQVRQAFFSLNCSLAPHLTWYFGATSHYVAQAGHELVILLLQPPE